MSPSSRPRSRWPDVGRAQGAPPVARVVFDPRTVREARDGQRGVKAQVQPNSGSAQGTLGGASQWNNPWSLLRRPDPGRPSDHGEVAPETRLRDTCQVPLHYRPLAQRGRGLPGRRSRTSKGRQGPLLILGGFRATSRPSPSTTSSGSWWGSLT